MCVFSQKSTHALDDHVLHYICTVTINTVLALVFDIAIEMYIACMMIEDQRLCN